MSRKFYNRNLGIPKNLNLKNVTVENLYATTAEFPELETDSIASTDGTTEIKTSSNLIELNIASSANGVIKARSDTSLLLDVFSLGGPARVELGSNSEDSYVRTQRALVSDVLPLSYAGGAYTVNDSSSISTINENDLSVNDILGGEFPEWSRKLWDLQTNGMLSRGKGIATVRANTGVTAHDAYFGWASGTIDYKDLPIYTSGNPAQHPLWTFHKEAGEGTAGVELSGSVTTGIGKNWCLDGSNVPRVRETGITGEAITFKDSDGISFYVSNSGTAGAAMEMAAKFDQNGKTWLYDVPVGSNDALHRSATGQVTRVVSTARAKKEIGEHEWDPRFLLEVTPTTWRYDPLKVSTEDEAVHFSAIAEDLAAVEPRAVSRDEEGRPSGLGGMEVLWSLVALVQAQEKRITALEERLISDV